jgi:peroxiredoxin
MKARRWLSGTAATACLLAAAVNARGDATADWQQIVAMDKAAPLGEGMSREEAQAATIDYLRKQEDVIRTFIATYPDDTHEPDAKFRLAHLLATRADLEQDPAERRASDAVLDKLEQEPAMKDRRADVEFARISIFMQRVDAISGANLDALVEPLLAEVASAFEEQPRSARALLEQALPKAKTPELQARINDDLKRLALVGKPLEMKWTAVDGTRIDLQNFQGKVVLIYYFASWSAPSMQELEWVRQLAAHFGADSVQPLGICLDSDPVSVPAMLADHNIAWPVYCDGAGWHGQLVRSLGINALPTLWIVDRDGILRALDAKGDAESLIQRAAQDSGQ